MPALVVLLAPVELAEPAPPWPTPAGEPEPVLDAAGLDWPTLGAEPLVEVEGRLLALLDGVDAPAEVEGDGTAEGPVLRPPEELPEGADSEFPGNAPTDGTGRGAASVGASTVFTPCWFGAATAGFGRGIAGLREPIVCIVTVGVGGVASCPFADGGAGALGGGMAREGACHPENAGTSTAMAITSAVLRACCDKT